ncbi:Ankyrin repeat-containing domain protein [Naviculisporaceae sp. PSN 640]
MDDDVLNVPSCINLIKAAERSSINLIKAAETGDIDLAKFVLEILENLEIHPDIKDEQDRTPLILAARGGHWEVVKTLLEHNSISGERRVDVNYRTPHGLTALRAALDNRWPFVSELLVRAHGIDVFMQYSDGWTPLGAAAAQGYQQVVDDLITLYRRRNNREALRALHMNRVTPLFLAVDNGHYPVVKSLLDNLGLGAIDDPSYPVRGHPSGQTALMLATAQGRISILKLLLQRGARTDIKNDAGDTALSIAYRSFDQTVIQILETRQDEGSRS